jgi:hypothetical protein
LARADNTIMQAMITARVISILLIMLKLDWSLGVCRTYVIVARERHFESDFPIE